jgi:hypothetical protein
MKKAIIFIWGIIFTVCFASCKKETVQPNNEKKASTSQSSSSQETPAPATPTSGCPQAPPPGCPHQPVDPMAGMH